MRHVHLLPTLSIIDPQLTLELPKDVTASSGLDAVTQVIEPFVSCKANVFVDAICRDAIAKGANSLRRVFLDGSDIRGREQMAWVSLSGGLALANAGLGAVHGFAGPIGGMFNAPHGAVCGRLLPAVVKANIEICQKIGNQNILGKYHEISSLVDKHHKGSLSKLVWWLDGLVEELSIPRLAHWGITKDDIDSIVEKSKASSSMRGNPVELNYKILANIIQESL
jgi:alcohol dehydrogenase class IV